MCVNIYNEGGVPMCNPVGQCICVFNRSVFLQVFDARVRLSERLVSMPATAPALLTGCPGRHCPSPAFCNAPPDEVI